MKSILVKKDYSDFDFSGVLYPNGSSYVQSHIDGGVGILGTYSSDLNGIVIPALGVSLEEVPTCVSEFKSRIETLGLGSLESFSYFSGMEYVLEIGGYEVFINLVEHTYESSFIEFSEEMFTTLFEACKELTSSLTKENGVVCVTIDKSCDNKIYEGLSNISIENKSPFTDTSFDGHYALVYLI